MFFEIGIGIQILNAFLGSALTSHDKMEDIYLKNSKNFTNTFTNVHIKSKTMSLVVDMSTIQRRCLVKEPGRGKKSQETLCYSPTFWQTGWLLRHSHGQDTIAVCFLQFGFINRLSEDRLPSSAWKTTCERTKARELRKAWAEHQRNCSHQRSRLELCTIIWDDLLK